jgi:hypothetical protein
VSPPGNAHGGRATEVLCGELAEDIITLAGAVMMDWTGWSSPTGAARQTEREDSSGPSTTRNVLTSDHLIVTTEKLVIDL